MTAPLPRVTRLFTSPQVSSRLSLGYAAILAVVTLYLNRRFYHDDSYISLRYARHLIQGKGLVWNSGERVQGYTNFLHVVTESLLGLMGLDLVLASRIIGVTAFLLLLAITAIYVRHTVTDERSRTYWHLPIVLTLTAAPLLVWSIGGLEGTLFSLFVATGMLLLLTASDVSFAGWLTAASGVCFGLAALTRPDGIIFAGVSLLWLLTTRGAAGRKRQAAAIFTASAGVVIAPYLLWQTTYYGDIFPNTFYAKTGVPTLQRLAAGLSYASSYAIEPPFLLPAAFALLTYSAGARVWRPKLTYAGLCVSAYVAYVVLAGGDQMPSYRLFAPLIVPMSLLLWMTLPHLTARWSRTFTAVLGCAIVVLSSLQLLSDRLNPRGENPAAADGMAVGRYIADAWPAGSVVALHTAGSTPYYADGNRYIDMLGLNDRHIARRRVRRAELRWQRLPGHAKGDGAYVLSRRPDYIILGPAAGTEVSKPWFLSDQELARDPSFTRDYTMSQVMLDRLGRPVREHGHVFTYYSRSGRSNGTSAPRSGSSAVGL